MKISFQNIANSHLYEDIIDTVHNFGHDITFHDAEADAMIVMVGEDSIGAAYSTILDFCMASVNRGNIPQVCVLYDADTELDWQIRQLIDDNELTDVQYHDLDELLDNVVSFCECADDYDYA